MKKKTTRLRLHVVHELWGVYAVPATRIKKPKRASALYPRQQATWNLIAGRATITLPEGTAKIEGQYVAGNSIEDLVTRILWVLPDARVEEVVAAGLLEITRKTI